MDPLRRLCVKKKLFSFRTAQFYRINIISPLSHPILHQILVSCFCKYIFPHNFPLHFHLEHSLLQGFFLECPIHQSSCLNGLTFSLCQKQCSISSVQFSAVTQLCPTLCDPMNCSTSGLPVHHQLFEFTQTHAHRVSDAIQPSHPLSSPSPPTTNPSKHQGLFQ